MPQHLDAADARAAFLARFDTFLLDCDGVVWLGAALIPAVKDTLRILRLARKRILFVSNNSTKSRSDYLRKFNSLGLEASIDEIFGSSYAAAYYIANQLNFPKDKKVFVCGMGGICDELAAEGVQFCGGPSDDSHVTDMAHLGEIKPDPEIGAVLFGFDININYTKIAKAFTYIRSNPECHFLATNSDLTYPAAGTVFPGTGALLAALSAPLQRQPVVLGKPHQTMLDVIVNKCHLDRHRTCMVGDRLDTDIEFGKLGGLSTLLVMTGVTTTEELSKSSIQPDFVIQSLGDFASEIIMFSDLEADYVNPIDLCNKLNQFIIPEHIIHAFLWFIFLISGSWLAFLFNTPLVAWHAYKVVNNRHLFDATEIFRTLGQQKTECFSKLIFYLFSFFYYLYRMIESLISSSKAPHI